VDGDDMIVMSDGDDYVKMEASVLVPCVDDDDV